MTDYAELKQLAEACGDLNWRAIQENWCEWAIRDNHAYIATMRTKSAKHPGPCPDREAKAKFLCAMTPSVVLALIVENERLKRAENNDAIAYKAAIDRQEELRVERNLFKAESDTLLKDAERWRFIRDEWPKVKLVPNGDWFNSCFLEREIDTAMSKKG